MANIQQIIKELNKNLNSFNLIEAINSSNSEAKTRMYLVEPFFQIMRFNRGFENGCLIPEFSADFADLKGKKVDYAILLSHKPEIIIEVKKASTKLNYKHLSQLNDYFNNTSEAKIGILTNGIEYQFYCINKSNGVGLHPQPFYIFNWKNFNASNLEQLAKFYATSIDTNRIVEETQELFFIESFEDALFNELLDPSRDFVKSLYLRMGGKRLTSKLERQIKGLINSVSVKSALERMIIEEVSNAKSGIITTSEELKYYHIIKTIIAQHRKIKTNSIGYKDYKGKFTIIIDNNTKKKVCDLYITNNKRTIRIIDEKFDVPDFESILRLKKKLTDRALELI